MLAYRSGIFPWPLHEDLLTWFAPPKRAVLFFDNFHDTSLKKELSKRKFEFKMNQNFETVINECTKVESRKGQQGTWITQDLVNA
ncbi:MAG: hypothetical protein R3A13_01115 [Bdellovibrionota bacterium]